MTDINALTALRAKATQGTFMWVDYYGEDGGNGTLIAAHETVIKHPVRHTPIIGPDCDCNEDDKAIIVAAVNALPALIAEVKELRGRVERYRETEIHQLCNRLLAANEGLVSTIRSLDKVALCDWHDGIGGDEYLAQWLANRDARMKKMGAAEWLEEFASENEERFATHFIETTTDYLRNKAIDLMAEAEES